MTAEQQAILLAVMDAINHGTDIYGAVRRLPTPEPDKREMAAILNILRNPAVGFRHGAEPKQVLARILELLEDAAEAD